jgi:alkylmercury lyase
MLTQWHKTLDELAEAVAAALPDLDPAGQRLAIALYRLLAAGQPVAAADLAAATGLGDPEVAATLGSWPAVFTDSQGRVTGFWGLAISELSPAHWYETGGRVLYAWCAWGTLFLPGRLGQARVTSACPVTGELIELTVAPEGVTGTSHPGALVSFLMPDGPFGSGVIESFCHFVHFFASRRAGERWAAGHPGTFLLTLGEAAGLAARVNQRMFPDVLGAHWGQAGRGAGRDGR